jgi:hypothetical protein
MLVDGVGQLKTIHSGHADVGQNDRNIILQEQVERLAAGFGWDEVFAQLGEYGFVGEQFGGLIVYHQHVNFFFGAHGSFFDLRPLSVVTFGVFSFQDAYSQFCEPAPRPAGERTLGEFYHEVRQKALRCLL